MKNVNYIITQDSKEEFDFKGKSLGLSEKMGLFYSAGTGRKRIYRNGLDNPQKGLKLLKYKTIEKAQEVCDHTNKLHKSKFKIELYTNL